MRRVDEPDPANSLTWWTRGEVATLLRCSYTLVVKLERRGRLHPIIDPSGHHRFNPSEVRALRAKPIKFVPMTKGDREAEVFALLNDGKDLVEIVQIMRIDSEEVLRIWHIWKEGKNIAAMAHGRQRQAIETKRSQEEAKREAERAQRRAEQQERLRKLTEINNPAPTPTGRKK